MTLNTDVQDRLMQAIQILINKKGYDTFNKCAGLNVAIHICFSQVPQFQHIFPSLGVGWHRNTSIANRLGLDPCKQNAHEYRFASVKMFMQTEL